MVTELIGYNYFFPGGYYMSTAMYNTDFHYNNSYIIVIYCVTVYIYIYYDCDIMGNDDARIKTTYSLEML